MNPGDSWVVDAAGRAPEEPQRSARLAQNTLGRKVLQGNRLAEALGFFQGDMLLLRRFPATSASEAISILRLALSIAVIFALPASSATAQGIGVTGSASPRAEFLGGLGNDDVTPSTLAKVNPAEIIFLPPERLALGSAKAQQYANVFLPPGPTPRDGWPVVFMTLYGGGNSVFPRDDVSDGGVGDRLWEALKAGIAVVTWGAPPVGMGRGMFYPPGHPSGRYESFNPNTDNNYKDAEWVLQYFKQEAVAETYNFDVTRFSTYASSQGSVNLLWATMGPSRAKASGSLQVQTSTRVAAVVAVGAEGSIWAYDQGPGLMINAPQLFERADMPGVPADILSQVDEQLQKDASFTRWLTQSQDARDNNASQPICLLYTDPVKMVGGLVADTSLDAFGDPVLYSTIGQPYIHDSWNMIVHVNKLLGISQESLDFHLTDGNSVFALETGVAATLSPPFDVYTETYTGPRFSPDETRVGVNFLRRHLVLPLRGDAPLRVLLTDESEGSFDTWTWDFGDGATSSDARPVHTYVAPGTYDVTLTVSGSQGSFSKTRAGCVVVGGSVSTGIADGSFESQPSSGTPQPPWQILEGAGHLMRNSSDGDFPLDGFQWLDLSSLGTEGATPPSNPGGPGIPGSGGAGVGQSFQINDAATGLSLNVAFLRAGLAGDALDHDWMSVDISDGVASWNLYLADSNSPTPNTSLIHGLPQTATTEVRVDLAFLFPSLDATTVLTLSVEVGDGGDGMTLSRGYVDGVALFAPAAALLRNGSGSNSLCFAHQNIPILGTDWLVILDTSGHVGATLTAVVGYDLPLAGFPTAYGELLVALEPFGGANLFSTIAPSIGGIGAHTIPVPLDVTLAGQSLSTQGVILGGGVELCNALDLILGY
ncbi:MAG: PKD repeat protein [Planctomycetota bacterium]